jgi:hypothetical protein
MSTKSVFFKFHFVGGSSPAARPLLGAPMWSSNHLLPSIPKDQHHGLIKVPLDICQTGLWKTMRTLWTVSVQAKIWTNHLPNTSQKCYHYTNLNRIKNLKIKTHQTPVLPTVLYGW